MSYHAECQPREKIGMYSVPTTQNGNCKDRKCPFCGNLNVGGKHIKGTIKSAKMQGTVVVQIERQFFVAKFKRYESRRSSLFAHISPCFKGVKVGAQVVVVLCRPLAKNVRHTVVAAEGFNMVSE
eukprot:GHVN01074451.1.p1 GENE.GHVN01074451.1~~GHVN01074451.1.p1  ORF type:complete len:125 (+),score=3.87 GHVN01074451.1:2-376(+)